jgi:hypothetical protein
MARLDSEVADIDDINCKVIHSLCKIKVRDNLTRLALNQYLFRWLLLKIDRYQSHTPQSILSIISISDPLSIVLTSLLERLVLRVDSVVPLLFLFILITLVIT